MSRMSTLGRGLVVVLGTSALVTAVAAAPAHAGDTTTTFTLAAAGGLTISEPDSAHLGDANAGAASVEGSLGTVTVTDDRSLLVAAWTAQAQASDFKTGAGTTAETVAATSVAYAPGSTTGNATAVPAPGALGGTLPLPVMTGTGVGNNTESWNPTITITLPAQAVVGTYSGTITHSVS